MALDKVPAAMMSGLLVSETAPTNPGVGQRWYRASTAITYQYTNDGTSSFWLDISSSGIGTSTGRGVDFVGDIDPHKATNGTGLAVGSVYYNREKNRHFVCTDATSGANVWSGRYDGVGGTITEYESGGTFYKIHTFLSSGTFHLEDTTSIDILAVGGGGGGGRAYGGGGGAGGIVFKGDFSAGIGTYNINIGVGGAGGASNAANNGSNGTNSTFIQNTGSTINVTAGYGGGGGRDTQQAGNTGGTSSGGTFIWHGGKGGTGGASSGGAGYIGADGGYINGTTSQNTGTQHATETSATAGAGYTGASNIITDASTTTALLLAAVAGTNSSNVATTSSSSGTLYIGGSGAGAPNWAGVGAASGGIGGGAAGSGNMNQSSGGGPAAANGLANTGGGGGGQVYGSFPGGDGGSGIVIVRYAL